MCRACRLNWAPGGEHAYLLFPSHRGGHTVLVRLPAPSSLPELPEGGIKAADVDALANVVWRRDGLIFVGSDPDTYAYASTTVQRNIFRIPLR